MHRTVSAPPQRLLAHAAQFMTESGASVSAASSVSLTFDFQGGVSGTDQGLAALMGMWDLAAMTGMIAAHNEKSKQSVSLTAIDSGGGVSEVSIPDGDTHVHRLLRFWLLADVLREHLPVPMLEIAAAGLRVRIHNDRLDVRKRGMLRETEESIPMEDVASVEVRRRRVGVHLREGEILNVKAKNPGEANLAKEIIEGRKEVYARPRP